MRRAELVEALVEGHIAKSPEGETTELNKFFVCKFLVGLDTGWKQHPSLLDQ
jgi:hypothetical protein